MPSVIKKVLFGISLLVLATFLFLYFFPIAAFNLPFFVQKNERHVFGATFSTYYARDVLSLDMMSVYDAMLNELGIRYMRIPVYWNEIEQTDDRFDFLVYDELLRRADRAGVNVVLAIGRKLPRWPECFVPSWASLLNEEEQRQEILEMLEAVVTRYRANDVIEAWQVENEPFFELFGECPPHDTEFYDRELELVRSLSARPIVITDSGELGWWFGAAKRADIFGTTLYRSVWNKYFKHVSYPWPPEFYRFKRFLTGIFYHPKDYWVMELQAEPFAPVALPDYSIEAQLRRMNPKRLNNNVAFSRNTEFSRSYLWGVEWWYWLKEKGYVDLWDAGKEIFKLQ